MTVTVGELLSRYVSELWKPGRHRENSIGYVNDIGRIFPIRFSAITEEDFGVIVDKLREQRNSDATINRKMVALTKLLRKAQKDSLIPNVPVYRRIKEADDSLRYLSLTEERQIITGLIDHDPIYGQFASFLVDTGMKPGEAIAIRWENLVAGRLHIPETSMGAGRTIPLTRRTLQTILALEHEARGPYFRVDQQRFRLAWNAVKDELGWLDEAAIVPQVLRHTCASRLVMSGLNLHIVQRWLGIRNYKSMLRYEKLAKSDNFDLCVEALDAYRNP
ncbi:tyrosine-type recombinase/integrase [Brucella anthropi]|uniref:tyrosine-type recombinase/integrase n=1 Tax=Brucella anthropi TaxID=529 RepID=UPI002157989A|nr:tyrosine-type recombinase/integrase [Brucella anthropi]MCR8493665.1 tyrosine-type recombinase/integrase [Brucella anthropi]